MHELIGTPFGVKDVEAFLIKHKVIEPVIIIPDVKKDDDDDNDEHVLCGRKMQGMDFQINAMRMIAPASWILIRFCFCSCHCVSV